MISRWPKQSTLLFIQTWKFFEEGKEKIFANSWHFIGEKPLLEGKSPVINSVFGLILTATGIPLYGYFRKKALKEISG